ncbi:helix-turn-helix domain-containing protein [Abyssicoccus albus]|uniref:Helix-turn-helix protein n=1 Tax=Abyssicoccus albus TaxID=1817405 RepID=A0A3N5BB94_9BACL|nr:helix-turn-helix domain-containing protein [Abyssicoccus albus]RPF54794.1 helix-turn-helix protein [Abyssicoccus albus]
MNSELFLIVPKRLAMDDSLTSQDKSVYLAVLNHCNFKTKEGFPSRKTLEKEAKVSNKTLTKCLRNLTEKGYLEIVSRKSRNGNDLSNTYKVL